VRIGRAAVRRAQAAVRRAQAAVRMAQAAVRMARAERDVDEDRTGSPSQAAAPVSHLARAGHLSYSVRRWSRVARPDARMAGAAAKVAAARVARAAVRVARAVARVARTERNVDEDRRCRGAGSGPGDFSGRKGHAPQICKEG
jgi:hypothetical protein